MIYLWHESIGAVRQRAKPTNPRDRFHFDDGYASHRRAAATLARFGKRGTFFIVTRWVGLPGFLTWPDLRAMAADGHELGNHTASHCWLGRLPLEPRRLELREAQAALADVTGVAPVSFAYPFGRVDPIAAETVREFGFTLARGITEVTPQP